MKRTYHHATRRTAVILRASFGLAVAGGMPSACQNSQRPEQSGAATAPQHARADQPRADSPQAESEPHAAPPQADQPGREQPHRSTPAAEMAALDHRSLVPLLPMMAWHQKQNMMEHLVVDNEGDVISGDIGVVKKAIDANEAILVIIRAETDARSGDLPLS